MYTSINEFAKSLPPYKIIGEYKGCVAVDVQMRAFFIFKSELEKLAADNFSKANLMNGYFRGTAIIGPQTKKKSKRSTTDYSDPFHKGQVIPTEEEIEEFSDDEEFDFTYNSRISSEILNKLCDMYIPTMYVKGTVVKKLYLG